jgi:N-acetyl-alpha-D-muramate 1-phosphate uridylyltransferase
MLDVAILAGGLATRLRPLTETIPKSLVEINGRPFLWHQLQLLRSRGVERVVLCLGHLGEMVRESVGDGRALGVHVEYSFDGLVPLGTAGALKRALPLLGSSFFVLYGDSYLLCDWAEVQQTFLDGGKLGLITLCRNEDQWGASNVEFAEGRIVVYDKQLRTSRMHHIDYGLGALRREALDRLEEGKPYDLATLYQQLLSEGQLAAFEVTDRFYEIGSFSGIEELSAHLRQLQ